MKKIKYIISLLCFFIILGINLNSIATEFVLSDTSEEYKIWESLPEEERSRTIQPKNINIDFKQTIKRSRYNALLRENTTQSSYNLRTVIPNIEVRDQKTTSLCWAFSFSSVIETTLAKRTNRDSKIYSAAHIEYKATQMFNRNLNDGGNGTMAVAYAVAGNGPVLEEELPFSSVYNENDNNINNAYLAPMDNVDLNKDVSAKIEETTTFSDIYKKYENGTTKYYKDKTYLNEYTEEELQAARKLLKDHIQNYGALTAGLYTDIKVDTEGNYSSNYYNSTNSAYAYLATAQSANHAVTIVGWDDNYGVENFNEAFRPSNPGAYIVLNSYGEAFGEDGYMYVSYEDANIETNLLGINLAQEITEKPYDKIYQYDELGVNQGIGNNSASIWGANVFTRDISTINDKEEYINEIGIQLISTQGVEIYLNAANDNFLESTLVATPGALEAGYHTIKLPSPIKLTGEKFVVSVKYINTEGAKVPIEANLKESGLTYVSNIYDTATANPGESFISLDGTTWQELNGIEIGDTITLKNTNACIKAFTTYQEKIEDTDIRVTNVTLNETQINIEEGKTKTLIATIEPANATNKNIIWTSSNEEIATVDGGVVTAKKAGTAIITAATEDGAKTANCTITVAPKVVNVVEITLNKEQISIKEGETEVLTAIIEPTNATNKNVTWTSSNEEIATVDGGVVTAKKAGTAIITVTTEDGAKTANCTVTVENRTIENVNVEEVTLNKTQINIEEGKTETLIATIEPTNATNKNVIWTSSNEEIATVDGGVVTAKKAGTAIITVTTEDGAKTSNCTITVEPKIVNVVEITLNKEQISIKEGETEVLTAIIEPTNATNKNVTWTSSNEEIATVDGGVVTAKKAGTAIITATTEDGAKTTNCTVTVTEKTTGGILVTNITLNKSEVNVEVGDRTYLEIELEPIDATNKNVIWESSDENVVSIDENGIITAKKVGAATITVTSEDGNASASCKINVIEKTNTDDDIYKQEEINSTNDNTTANEPLPQTGINKVIIFATIIVLICGIVMFIKYRHYKEIK